MVVTIDGPTYILGDNMSVIFKTSISESQLRNKSNSICYHAVQEAVSMGECTTTHIPNLLNFVDLLTKVIYVSKIRRLVNIFFFDNYEYDWMNIIDISSATILDYKFDLGMTTLGGL